MEGLVVHRPMRCTHFSTRRFGIARRNVCLDGVSETDNLSSGWTKRCLMQRTRCALLNGKRLRNTRRNRKRAQAHYDHG
jgi:hypothetical protein